MNNAKEYYKATKYGKPNRLLKEVIECYLEPGLAIDLGCGAGKDTLYMLEKRI